MGTKIEFIREYYGGSGGYFTRAATTIQSGTGASVGGIADSIVILNRSGEGISDVTLQGMRGPFQDGEIYLGHRLEPRNIIWELEIVGNSLTALETNIDTFVKLITTARQAVSLASPSFTFINAAVGDPNPLIIQYTLQNGAVRCIKCFPTIVDLNWSKRRAFTQPVTIRFECATPTFYNPTPKSTVFTASGAFSSSTAMNYSGNYPDDAIIMVLGGQDVRVSGTTGNNASMTNVSVHIVPNSTQHFYTSGYFSYSSSTVVQPLTFVNMRTGYIQSSSAGTNPYVGLSDTQSAANFRVWPSADFTTTSYISLPYFVYCTFTPSGTSDVSIYSYEKFIGLESANH